MSWKKVVLVIVGLFVVVIIFGGVYLYTQRHELSDRAIESSFLALETEMILNLPDDLSEDEVRRIFSEVIRKVKEKKISEEALVEFAQATQTAMKDGKLDHAEVRAILAKLKEIIK